MRWDAGKERELRDHSKDFHLGDRWLVMATHGGWGLLWKILSSMSLQDMPVEAVKWLETLVRSSHQRQVRGSGVNLESWCTATSCIE